PAVQSPSTTRQDAPTLAQKELKKGVKAVSFLSKLIGNKKREEDSAVDDTSSISDQRPEGHNAEIFAQPLDSMGYSPHHAPPPAYIKVRSRHKPKRDFDRLFLAQHLHCKSPGRLQRTESNKLRRRSSVAQAQGESTVWAMEFSRDGRYLAAAGADMVVRVWKVLSNSDDRQQHEMQETEDAGGSHEHLSAPVFQSQPVHEFRGHTSTVLDLSWSKNNFLLSSSMDKTVRLWHVSRTECLCTFKHHDFVPSIAFHPKDDRFFLAGSLDSKLRLWSIPDKSVAYIAQLPDLITAVAFTPDGRNAVAGCLSGLCMFFETEGLKYSTQIHVRSTRGQNARGSKITGIQAHQVHTGETKLLITSNDSRIRLYNFRDKSLELKFKGNENNCSQIRATLSDDGKYVVCGSEDNKAYIWSLGAVEGDAVRRDKRPLEMFEAHETIATAVCFAPAKTRHLLSKSEDPIFDLCNPPHVMLMSRNEDSGGADSHNSSNPSRPASMAGSIQHTPAEAQEYSPAYVSRSGHKEGNIIVTADYSGNIKVFRQDCAWNKRRSEDWDRMSLFSKRGNRSATGVTRTGSVTTKASHPSLRDPRASMSSEGGSGGPAARIMTWRQGVSS
ncbi:WD40 repeat-like protein, partial [Polychaeton citri CBS 116435]